MKILQGCVRYPPAPGGAETVVKAYSEGLRDLGHEVEVITTDLYTETPFVKKEMPSEVNGINVTRHKAYTVSGEAHYVQHLIFLSVFLDVTQPFLMQLSLTLLLLF